MGGHLILEQPETGYRVGQDPVLLAAAVPIRPWDDFVDIGCGVGTLGLCVLARMGMADVKGLGVELNPDLADLAQANANENGMANFEVQQADFFALTPKPKTWVLSNPPFFKPGSGRLPTQPQRLQGRHGSVEIGRWINGLGRWVKPRGYMGLILDTEQVAETVAALVPNFGGITLLPLLGNQSKATADRCLLFARQGSRSPFQIAKPFVLRGDDGEHTPEARSVLMDAAALPIPLVK